MPLPMRQNEMCATAPASENGRNPFKSVRDANRFI
jgi:hypothetical protein